MTVRKEINTPIWSPLMLFSAVVVLLFLSSSINAQDNRPVNNKRQIRETRAKSVKHNEKATTRDIAGRKLRTRNKSTAQRAVYTANSPYKNKRRTGGDRVGKPIGGSAPGVRSRSAETARANVYPQKGPFVNNDSKKPSQAYSNRRELSRLARLQTRKEPPGKKKRVTPRSGSQAFVTRGKRNVYWGKYSKGERAITTDVAGRPLRTKNFRTPGNPVMKASDPYYGRKKTGDRAYKGTFRSGFATATRRGELPWKGDVSGQPIRKSKGRDNQVAGEPGTGPRISPGFSAQYMKKDFSRLRGIKPKKGGGGSVTGKYKSNQPLSPRTPGIGASYMRQDQNKLRGIKPVKGGGGSVTGKYKSNQPLSARAPGIGASYMRKDLNRLRGIKPVKGGGGSISARMKTNAPLGARAPGNPRVASMMGNYSGNMKSFRPPKGGGSVTGRTKKNNNNMPIPVRAPLDQRAANFQDNYQGFIKRDKISSGFSQDGLSYSGSIKARRTPKGGGSMSGRVWNNDNRPIPGKIPGGSANRIDSYQGNLTLTPKSFSRDGYDFSGYNKTKKPLKGGGSISGRLWNNDNKPIPGKTPGGSANRIDSYQGNLTLTPKSFSRDGYDFSGYNKTKKPLKGGGSISGRVWNNDNKPIPGKTPGGSASKIDTYQGNLKFTKKPEKGGGSVSGKLWNNNGEPLPVRMPTGDQAGDLNYAGKTKLPRFKREYVRNPNANEEALKKHRPYETVYQINGLMVSVKQKETGTKPKAVKGSMPGVPPSKATVKASEYSTSMKVYWEYKHNPSSADEAQKTIKYSKSFERATEFAGKTRLTKSYRHNPNSDRDALKVIAPARAYARVGDYQGNIKMNKFNHNKHFPDAEFAHSKGNNVKEERTIMTDVKLLWAKLFKKNSTQPDAVKDKVRRPRYDKKEKELWKDLYD